MHDLARCPWSVAGADGRMIVVGLERTRAAAKLARLAPEATAGALARRRAEALDLRPAAAARRIVEGLEAAR